MPTSELKRSTKALRERETSRASASAVHEALVLLWIKARARPTFGSFRPLSQPLSASASVDAYCRTASVSNDSLSRVMTLDEANRPSASSLAAKRTEASIHSRDAPSRTSILSAFGKVESKGLKLSSLARKPQK